MKKTFVLIASILFLFNVASAQEELELFENWYEYLNIPEDFSTFPNIIYLVLIPFLAVMAIVFGILTFIFSKIFNKRVRLILALVFASSLLYLGPLLAIVSTLLQFTSVFSVVVFFVLLFFLISIQIFRRTVGGYGSAKKIFTRVKGYQKTTSDIDKDVTELLKDKGKLRKKTDDIQKEILRLTKELETAQMQFQTTGLTGSAKGEFTKKSRALEHYQNERNKMWERINKIDNRIDELRKRKRELKLDLD